jgi:hypothetical protein
VFKHVSKYSKHVSNIKRDTLQVEVSFEVDVDIAAGTFEGTRELVKIIRLEVSYYHHLPPPPLTHTPPPTTTTNTPHHNGGFSPRIKVKRSQGASK